MRRGQTLALTESAADTMEFLEGARVRAGCPDTPDRRRGGPGERVQAYCHPSERASCAARTEMPVPREGDVNSFRPPRSGPQGSFSPARAAASVAAEERDTPGSRSASRMDDLLRSRGGSDDIGAACAPATPS